MNVVLILRDALVIDRIESDANNLVDLLVAILLGRLHGDGQFIGRRRIRSCRLLEWSGVRRLRCDERSRLKNRRRRADRNSSDNCRLLDAE
jgi:hypothetical protein